MNSPSVGDRAFPTTLFGLSPTPAAGPATDREASGLQRLHMPREPVTLEESGLDENDVLPLILKYLFLCGQQSGHEIANQLRLNIAVVTPLIAELRRRSLVAYKGAALVNDYIYQLTNDGLEQARHLLGRCSYCGAAPVSLAQYRESVARQSHRHRKPTLESIRLAMGDLVIEGELLRRVGQAVYSGSSLLLYGAPGNGKTSIARSAIAAYRDTIWIPRAITVSGEIIRLFDTNVHQEVQSPVSRSITQEQPVDRRWVEIRRPVIVVGGEMTLQHLEAIRSEVNGIIEAPIHVKSNCGCLVVDDFGRQRISPNELLNRWIIPLESGHDYLNLPSGRQIEVDFNQLLVFSTNLPPAALCDEAFLRRIRYKIEVPNPSEPQFRHLLAASAARRQLDVDADAIERLIETHYLNPQRPMRFCHAVDLIRHAQDNCDFFDKPRRLTWEVLNTAAQDYFVGQ